MFTKLPRQKKWCPTFTKADNIGWRFDRQNLWISPHRIQIWGKISWLNFLLNTVDIIFCEQSGTTHTKWCETICRVLSSTLRTFEMWYMRNHLVHLKLDYKIICALVHKHVGLIEWTPLFIVTVFRFFDSIRMCSFWESWNALHCLSQLSLV